MNPTLGRVLPPSDDIAPGAHPIAVASYAWWQHRMAGAPGVLGATATIGGTTYTIIGVAQAGFSGIVGGQSPDLWIPLAMEKEVSPAWTGLDKPLHQSLFLIGRLKPGVSLQQANANVSVLYHQMLAAYVGPGASPDDLDNINHASLQTRSVTGQHRHALSKMLIAGQVALSCCLSAPDSSCAVCATS